MALWLAARRKAWATASIVVLTQVVLFVELVDGRVKLKFLEPLSMDLLSFTAQEADLLASGSITVEPPSRGLIDPALRRCSCCSCPVTASPAERLGAGSASQGR